MTTAQVILSYAWAGNGKKIGEQDLNGNEPIVSDLIKVQDTIAQIAKSELREDNQTREQCLKQFKEWIHQNRDVENCITGKWLEAWKYFMGSEILNEG